MSEDERERRYRQGALRRQRIAEFRERQRTLRDWIEFPEIADWCARSVTGAGATAEEEARTLAYRRLDDSARRGELDKILWLHPRRIRHGRTRRWLTRDMLQIVDNLPGAAATRGQLPPGGSIRDVAVYCWLPQEATRRWLAAHGYPWPGHFEPVGPAAGPAHSNTAQPNRSGTRTNRSAAAEKACAEWLSRLAERPASKDAAFEAAKAAVASVGALSRKAFERQWPITVPDDWKRGGRRKITTPEI